MTQPYIPGFLAFREAPHLVDLVTTQVQYSTVQYSTVQLLAVTIEQMNISSSFFLYITRSQLLKSKWSGVELVAR